MNYNIEDFNYILQNRRSIYPYQFKKNKKVPDEIIWQILENANRAPTHKLTQPWRFIVFSGEGLKEFADFQVQQYKELAGDSFKEKKVKNLAEYPLMSSHVIAIAMKRTIAISIPEEEELLAVGCAIENIYLSLTAYGLGGYLSTGSVSFLNKSKHYFGLEENDKLVGVFFIGYPAEIRNPLSKREAVKEKVKWVDSSSPKV